MIRRYSSFIKIPSLDFTQPPFSDFASISSVTGTLSAAASSLTFSSDFFNKLPSVVAPTVWSKASLSDLLFTENGNEKLKIIM